MGVGAGHDADAGVELGLQFAGRTSRLPPRGFPAWRRRVAVRAPCGRIPRWRARLPAASRAIRAVPLDSSRSTCSAAARACSAVAASRRDRVRALRREPDDEEHREERRRHQHRGRDRLPEAIFVLLVLHPVVGVQSILDADDSRWRRGGRAAVRTRACAKLRRGHCPPASAWAIPSGPAWPVGPSGGRRAGEIDFQRIDLGEERELSPSRCGSVRSWPGGVPRSPRAWLSAAWRGRRWDRCLEEIDVFPYEFGERLAEDAGVVEPLADVGPVGLLVPGARV